MSVSVYTVQGYERNSSTAPAYKQGKTLQLCGSWFGISSLVSLFLLDSVIFDVSVEPNSSEIYSFFSLTIFSYRQRGNCVKSYIVTEIVQYSTVQFSTVQSRTSHVMGQQAE